MMTIPHFSELRKPILENYLMEKFGKNPNLPHH